MESSCWWRATNRCTSRRSSDSATTSSRSCALAGCGTEEAANARSSTTTFLPMRTTLAPPRYDSLPFRRIDLDPGALDLEAPLGRKDPGAEADRPPHRWG